MLAHARALLTSVQGGTVDYIDAGLRKTDASATPAGGRRRAAAGGT